MKEQVLVFDEGFMEGFVNLPGFSQNQDDINRFENVCLRVSYFVDRENTEKNLTRKQIIPYTIITNNNKILAYKRTKKGGEGRLHDKWSIGVGGHINPEDKGLSLSYYEPTDTIKNAMNRELNEEVGINNVNNPIRHETIGLLYDPSNSVGEVHFGVVIKATPMFQEEIKSNEDAIDNDLRWLTVEEAIKLPNLENWSQMILKGLMNG